MGKSRIEVLEMMEKEMADDVRKFDGRPFSARWNGRTVAEYFGSQGAAIAALARIMEEREEEKNGRVEEWKGLSDEETVRNIKRVVRNLNDILSECHRRKIRVQIVSRYFADGKGETIKDLAVVSAGKSLLS